MSSYFHGDPDRLDHGSDNDSFIVTLEVDSPNEQDEDLHRTHDTSPHNIHSRGIQRPITPPTIHQREQKRQQEQQWRDLYDIAANVPPAPSSLPPPTRPIGAARCEPHRPRLVRGPRFTSENVLPDQEIETPPIHQATIPTFEHSPTLSQPPTTTPALPSPPLAPNPPTPLPRFYLNLGDKLSVSFANTLTVLLCFWAWQLSQQRSKVTKWTTEAKTLLLSDCQILERAVTTLASFPALATNNMLYGFMSSIQYAVLELGQGLEIALEIFLKSIDFLISILVGVWKCFLQAASQSGIPILSDLSQQGVNAIENVQQSIINLLSIPVGGLQQIIQQEFSSDLVQGLTTNLGQETIPLPEPIVFCNSSLNLSVVDRIGQDLEEAITVGVWILVGLVLLSILLNMIWIGYQHYRWNRHVDRIAHRMTVVGLENRNDEMDQGRKLFEANHSVTKSKQSTDTGLHRLDKFLQPNPSSTRTNHHHHYLSTDLLPSTTTARSKTCTKIINTQTRLDAIRIQHLTTFPIQFRFSQWISRKLFSKNLIYQNRFQWWTSFIFQTPVMICLMTGGLGLLYIYLQLYILNQIRARHEIDILQTISSLASIAQQLTLVTMTRYSIQFANLVNSRITELESTLQQKVFGEIVTGMMTMNQSLTTVTTTLTDGIQSAFGSVPLLSTLVMTVVQCLLINKIVLAQEGIDWVIGKSNVVLPRIPANILVLSENAIEETIFRVLGEIEQSKEGTPSSLSPNPSSSSSSSPNQSSSPLVLEQQRQQYHYRITAFQPLFSNPSLFLSPPPLSKFSTDSQTATTKDQNFLILSKRLIISTPSSSSPSSSSPSPLVSGNNPTTPAVNTSNIKATTAAALDTIFVNYEASIRAALPVYWSLIGAWLSVFVLSSIKLLYSVQREAKLAKRS